MESKIHELILSYSNDTLVPDTEVSLISPSVLINNHIRTDPGCYIVDVRGEVPTGEMKKTPFGSIPLKHGFLLNISIPKSKLDKVKKDLYIDTAGFKGFVISPCSIAAGIVGTEFKWVNIAGRKVWSPTTGLYYFFPDCCLKIAR